MAAGFATAVEKTEKYIDDNAAVAVKLNKPLVIEEFGLPRDGQSFDVSSTTELRDQYFSKILSQIGKQNISGANFWAFGGTARPIKGQLFWKPGDDRMGDPRMEEQGLNSVFDGDKSTWKVIKGRACTPSKIANYLILLSELSVHLSDLCVENVNKPLRKGVTKYSQRARDRF